MLVYCQTKMMQRKTRFFPLRKRGRTYILTIFFCIFISLLIQNLYTLNIISILICLTITGITILNYNVCISNNIFGYIWRGFAPGFVNYKKGCTRLAVASDKVYQLFAHGRWFSPGTPTSTDKVLENHIL
jgi:hypothetical protein